MNLKKTMIKREVAGETVLIPLGNALLESNGLFILTETGAFIWDLLPTVQDANEIAQKMTEEYDVTAEQALQDVEAFLQKLREFGILD